jgi:hypothetical protein
MSRKDAPEESDISSRAPSPGEFESFFQKINRQGGAPEPLPETDSEPAPDWVEAGEFTRFFKPELPASLPAVSPPPALATSQGGEFKMPDSPPAVTSEFIAPVESGRAALAAMQPPADDAATIMLIEPAGKLPFSPAFTVESKPGRSNKQWLMLAAILTVLFILFAMFLMKK